MERNLTSNKLILKANLIKMNFYRSLSLLFHLLMAFVFSTCTSSRDIKDKSIEEELNLTELEKDSLKTNRGLKADHYPITNEYRLDLFFDDIKDIGGGYLGVGTDQNLTLIAKAKSKFAILMDFDPQIVGVNKLHIFFLKNSNSYTDFKNFWDRKNFDTTLAFIRANEKKEIQILEKALRLGQQKFNGVPERLGELEILFKKVNLVTFSHNEEEFQFLRKLALENKIIAIEGDLNGKKSMKNISQELIAKNLKLEVIYFSNAEEYFTYYSPNFKENIEALPISENSLILRTASTGTRPIFGFPEFEKYPDIPMHYNIQKVTNLKKWFLVPKKFASTWMLLYRTKKMKGYSTIDKEPKDFNLLK